MEAYKGKQKMTAVYYAPPITYQSALGNSKQPEIPLFFTYSKYITGKLEGAGCRHNIFDENAIEAILNAANGTPRMINKLCNRSLMIGATFGQDITNAETIGKAVEDTQLG